MTDTFDELRMLSMDCRGLKADERALIDRAADELETTQRTLSATMDQLIESQQMRIALNDRLLALTGRPKMILDGPLSIGASAKVDLKSWP